MDYKTTIGLEIHAELKTRTKMFCGCINNPMEAKPNVNVCPICLAHPGVLPTINEKAVEYVVKVGFALDGNIATKSNFDRKSYFYPDLPKGYQISQFDKPLCIGGYIEINIDGTTKKITHNANSYPSFTSLLGILPSTLHSPDDLDLIKGKPSSRRKFLNLYLAQEDPLYVHHYLRFTKALKQRNHLLKSKKSF